MLNRKKLRENGKEKMVMLGIREEGGGRDEGQDEMEVTGKMQR